MLILCCGLRPAQAVEAGVVAPGDPLGNGAMTHLPGMFYFEEYGIAAVAPSPSADFAYFYCYDFEFDHFLIKVELPSLTVVATLPLLATDVWTDVIVDNNGAFLYGFSRFSMPGEVVKIDLQSMTRSGALTLQPGEGEIGAAVIDAGSDFAYFATGEFDNDKLVKVDLATFQRVSAIGYDVLIYDVECAAIDPAGQFAYVGSRSGIGKIDLSTFTFVSRLPLDIQRPLFSVAIDPAGDFAYFGTVTNQGKIVKVDLSDFSEVSTLTLNPDEGALTHGWIDPEGRSAYFAAVGISGNSGNIVKLDLAGFTRTAALPLGEYESSAQALFADPTGETLYIQTNYIGMRRAKTSHKGALRGTRISLAEVAQLQTMRFYSHTAAGNLRLAIYDDNEPKQLMWQSGVIPNTAENDFLDVAITSGTPAAINLPTGDYWLTWATDSTQPIGSYTAGAPQSGLTGLHPFGDFPAQQPEGYTTQTTENWTQSVIYTALDVPKLVVTPAEIDLGLAAWNGNWPEPVEVKVRNGGTQPLDFTGNGVELLGAEASNFSIGSSPVISPLAPGAERTYELNFYPMETGSLQATLRISTNDADRPTFDIPISVIWTGYDDVPAYIEVFQNGFFVLPDSGPYSLGYPYQGSTPTPREFSVTNLGAEDMLFTDLSVSPGFIVTDPLPASLPPGESASFRVRLDTSTAGLRSGAVQIETNAVNIPSFSFLISGEVLPQVTPSFSALGPLRVVREGAAILSVNHLATVDADSTPTQLLYTLATAPQHGTLSLNGTPLGSTDTFTQADVLARTLRYDQTGGSSETDAFGFILSDQHNHTLPLQNFTILIGDPPVWTTRTAYVVGDGMVLEVNTATGERRELSGPNRGSGPAFQAAVDLIVEDAFSLLVLEETLQGGRLMRVHRESGDRTVFSADTDATQGDFGWLGDGEMLRMSDGSILLRTLVNGFYYIPFDLVVVDPATGKRRLIESLQPQHSTNVGFGLAMEPDGNVLFINPYSVELLRSQIITLPEGDQVHSPLQLSNFMTSGTQASYLNGLAVAEDGEIFVGGASHAPQQGFVLAIDPQNGVRSTVSDSGVVGAPAFGVPTDLKLEPEGTLLLLDSGLEAIFQVDPASGQRRIVSGDPAGANIGSGPQMLNAEHLAFETPLSMSYAIPPSTETSPTSVTIGSLGVGAWFMENFTSSTLAVIRHPSLAPNLAFCLGSYWDLRWTGGTFQTILYFYYTQAELDAAGLAEQGLRLWRSNDGGQTWTELLITHDTANQRLITSEPQSAFSLWAITGDPRSGLDSGQWSLYE